MALLTIRDPSLGEITWEPPADSEIAEVLGVAEGRALVETELTRFMLLLKATLSSGPVMAQNLGELQQMVMMLARVHRARLKRATQN